ncbi:MAG: alpha/beta hydrolase, partial [Bdellovibrionales bacterium]|nr:alpha/beta hydrolase [Oligoflexia bacterium]
KPALIFVHGGPGLNSHDFEVTTAQRLSDEGFLVVTYDQRGQGRSREADSSEFTYQQYAKDLRLIIESLHLIQPTLIAHSHGGSIAIHFDQYYPGMAKKIALVSAPLNFWDSISSIEENCASKYSQNGEIEKLRELAYIHQALFASPMNLSGKDYAYAVGSTFTAGLDCGLYSVKRSSPKRDQLNALLKANPMTVKLSGQSSAMPAFLSNENYVHGDSSEFVFQNRAHYCGIYGDEDGLFTPLVRATLQSTLNNPGEELRFKLIQGASHALYIDQQDAFIEALQSVCKIK